MGQLLAFQDTALGAQQAGINLQPQELVRMHTNYPRIIVKIQPAHTKTALEIAPSLSNAAGTSHQQT